MPTFPGCAAIRNLGADTLALSHSLGPGSALTRIFDARELGRETWNSYFAIHEGSTMWLRTR
jgi:hypothetical protein